MQWSIYTFGILRHITEQFILLSSSQPREKYVINMSFIKGWAFSYIKNSTKTQLLDEKLNTKSGKSLKLYSYILFGAIRMKPVWRRYFDKYDLLSTKFIPIQTLIPLGIIWWISAHQHEIFTASVWVDIHIAKRRVYGSE